MSPSDGPLPTPENRLHSPKFRLITLFSRVVWWLLLVVLVLFALYVGIGRQLTQNVDKFRSDLTHELSARLGHDVTIGSLSSRWYWLDPSFTAQDIEITNPDTGVPVLNLQHLTIRFDVLASLMRFRVVFADFDAEGLDLTLNQNASGEVGVRGADIPEPLNNRFQHWLEVAGKWLSEPYIKVTRVSLGIRDNEGNLRHLDIPQLDLLYHKGLFRASGRAMRSATTEQLASFTLVGKQFFRGSFSGQLYLEMDSGRLFDGLVDEYEWQGVRVEGFDLGGEAWLTFREGVLQQVNGIVETPYMQLGSAGESLAPLEDIRAHFGWRRHQRVMESSQDTQDEPQTIGEWHLKQLSWVWNGNKVPPFSLLLSPDPEGVTVTADALPLRPLRRLAQALPLLPTVAKEALEHYQPAGFLDNFKVSVPGSRESSFELTAQLRNVAAAAYGGAPAASGIDGFIYVDQHAGYVSVRAAEQPATLAFPELFGSEWSMPELSATVAWLMDGPIIRVYSNDIRMRYGENTQLSGGFDLKLDNQGEDNLGLRVGVENAKASMLGDFVPQKAVDPGLYDWLTTAITEGDVTSGVYYGHGQIGANMPPGAFVSSMWYEFEKGRVRYDPQWPEVSGVRGRVSIQNGDTLVKVEQGRTGGLSLSPSTVEVIPQGNDALVRVNVSAPVPGEAVAYWMANSPFGDMAGAETAKLKYEGDYKLDLGIDLPLANTDKVVVEANIFAINGAITHRESGLHWDNISGGVTYHSVNGFSGDVLSARFLGDPVSVSLSQASAVDGSALKALTIQQTGSASVPGVFEQAGLVSSKAIDGTREPTQYGLSGTFDYTAQLEVAAGSAPLITISSDLEGLAIDWPGSFAKEAEQTAPLTAEIDPEAEGGLGISGVWEDRATFDLLWKRSGVDLTFGELYLGDQMLTNIDLEALDLGDRWILSSESERAVGRLVIPNDGSTVTADFAVLRLVRDSNQAKTEPELLTIEQQLKAFRAMDMASWPNVNVSISDLQLNNDSLGRWSFRLLPEHQQLNISGIQGRLRSLTLLGDMTWGVMNNRETSQFSGTVTGGELADLDEFFDSDIPLTNKKTNVEFELDWAGRPDEFEFSTLNGEVSFRFDDGVILKSSNSAQLFRLFNILNTDTIWRRLKLDFSDLYKRGVAFDAISGTAELERGLLTLAPELQVVGPSGAFKLSGSTNLVNENLDMRLVVVLPLTQNLPLAALLMGAGAPIGGALFVLDKILGDPLSKLTSATYDVTGTWGEPKVD